MSELELGEQGMPDVRALRLLGHLDSLGWPTLGRQGTEMEHSMMKRKNSPPMSTGKMRCHRACVTTLCACLASGGCGS